MADNSALSGVLPKMPTVVPPGGARPDSPQPPMDFGNRLGMTLGSIINQATGRVTTSPPPSPIPNAGSQTLPAGFYGAPAPVAPAVSGGAPVPAATSAGGIPEGGPASPEQIARAKARWAPDGSDRLNSPDFPSRVQAQLSAPRPGNISVINGGRYTVANGHAMVNPTQAAAMGELQMRYSPQMMALRELLMNEQMKHQLAMRLASLPEGDPARAEIASRYQNFNTPEAQAHENNLRLVGQGLSGIEGMQFMNGLGLGMR